MPAFAVIIFACIDASLPNSHAESRRETRPRLFKCQEKVTWKANRMTRLLNKLLRTSSRSSKDPLTVAASVFQTTSHINYGIFENPTGTFGDQFIVLTGERLAAACPRVRGDAFLSYIFSRFKNFTNTRCDAWHRS